MHLIRRFRVVVSESGVMIGWIGGCWEKVYSARLDRRGGVGRERSSAES